MTQVSEKRKEQNSEYAKATKAHLRENPVCQICIRREVNRANMATHTHHQRGKVGRLLCDRRFFFSACDTCHPVWVHQTNVAEARKIGVLAKPEDWNVYPG